MINVFLFLPFIFPVLIFIIILVNIVKHVKKSKTQTEEYNENSNIFDISEIIKNRLQDNNSDNVCEYCGSNLNNKTECENCGAKVTKK